MYDFMFQGNAGQPGMPGMPGPKGHRVSQPFFSKSVTCYYALMHL